MLANAIRAAAAATLLLYATSAFAQGGWTSTASSVNMRSGPGVAHRVVTTLPSHAHVFVHTCTHSANWCNVTHGNLRGWVSGGYLIRHVPAPYGGGYAPNAYYPGPPREAWTGGYPQPYGFAQPYGYPAPYGYTGGWTVLSEPGRTVVIRTR